MTCWEIFTCGKLPYPGVDPSDLPKFLERGRRLEKPDNAACSDIMLAHTHTHTHIHTHMHAHTHSHNTIKYTYFTFDTHELWLCHFRYTLMLKCWDSDPEDRPSFTKIGSTISKALQTLEEYIDISAADMSKVPPTQDEIKQPVLVKKSLWYFHALGGSITLLCSDRLDR